jgi:raffinose/stachyose/melibiose transport system substrate-binding protein
MLTDIFQRVIGPGVMDRVTGFVASQNWNAPDMLRASTIFQDAALNGFFANGFETADYGTAQSMFTSGQSALYYMGSWEAGMAVNPALPEDFRENLRVFMLPAVDGGRGTTSDVAAWNGGGYFVTANSAVKDAALDLLQYFFRPENWNRLTWEHNICMSAQDFMAFQTGQETPVQLGFIAALQNSTSVSGTPLGDMGSADFKTRSERLMVDLAIGSVTPEQFLQELSNAS